MQHTPTEHVSDLENKANKIPLRTLLTLDHAKMTEVGQTKMPKSDRVISSFLIDQGNLRFELFTVFNDMLKVHISNVFI